MLSTFLSSRQVSNPKLSRIIPGTVSYTCSALHWSWSPPWYGNTLLKFSYTFWSFWSDRLDAFFCQEWRLLSRCTKIFMTKPIKWTKTTINFSQIFGLSALMSVWSSVSSFLTGFNTRSISGGSTISSSDCSSCLRPQQWSSLDLDPTFRTGNKMRKTQLLKNNWHNQSPLTKSHLLDFSHSSIKIFLANFFWSTIQ